MAFGRTAKVFTSVALVKFVASVSICGESGVNVATAAVGEVGRRERGRWERWEGVLFANVVVAYFGKGAEKGDEPLLDDGKPLVAEEAAHECLERYIRCCQEPSVKRCTSNTSAVSD
jgi:hypothetical protein